MRVTSSSSSSSQRTLTPNAGQPPAASHEQKAKIVRPDEDQTLAACFSHIFDPERNFLKGIIPGDGMDRYRIIQTLVLNEKLEILNWMADNDSITGCRLNLANKADFEGLMKYLLTATRVTTLDLSNNSIGRYPDYTYEQQQEGTTYTQYVRGAEYDIQSLANVLEKNQSLTCLNLSKNELTSAHMKTLAQGLRSNTTLTQLNICHNEEIGQAGIQELLSIFPENRTLKVIRFEMDNATRKGLVHTFENNRTPGSFCLINHRALVNQPFKKKDIKALLQAAETNTSLSNLDLHEPSGKFNSSYKKAEAVAAVLTNNKTLTSFDFRGHKISTKGIASIADALANNTTLESFAISLDGGDQLARFLEGLGKNTKLRSLDLRGSELSKQDIHVLEKFFKENRTCALMRAVD